MISSRDNQKILVCPLNKSKKSLLGDQLRLYFGVVGHIVVAFFIVVVSAFFLNFVEANLIDTDPEGGNVTKEHNTQVDSRHDKNWIESIFGISTAQAAEKYGYEAKMIIGSSKGDIRMAPGEEMTYTAGFKNIGQTVWQRDGDSYVSVYTYDPKYRQSDFEDDSWLSAEQPAVITSAEVAPGHLGFISFTLRAPSTPGTYTETFHLAAEDLVWVPGGQFTLTLVVVSGEQSSSTKTTEIEPVKIIEPEESTEDDNSCSSCTTDSESSYEAKLLIKSHKNIELKPSETVVYRAGFKNIGQTAWGERKIKPDSSKLASYNRSTTFYHRSWESNNLAFRSNLGEVNPGSLDFAEFRLKAPSRKGEYTAKFKLVVDGVDIPGGEFEIPISVTSGASGSLNKPKRDTSEVDNSTNRVSSNEPIMRVGLFTIDDELTIKANKPFKLKDSSGKTLSEVPKNTVITIDYKSGRYNYIALGVNDSTSKYLRLEPDSNGTIFTVTNYDSRPSWNTSLNYNQFRDTLELRHNDYKDRTWLIEELPMSYYLKGLAETSNYSPVEFQKVMAVAARTYAYYHYERQTKHAKEFFYVDSTYDQVYRGYTYESIMPRLSEAVEATKGKIVTYDGDTAITPYYSRSDGRTRSWSEVWYGESPEWLVSVPVPCDIGKTLWGHGVGMSAQGALCMVNNGMDYDDTLKHFYTGIDLTNKW